MGYIGQPRHPEGLRVVESVFEKARNAGKPPGITIGNNADLLVDCAKKGAQLLMAGNDYTLMLSAADQLANDIREQPQSPVRQ